MKKPRNSTSAVSRRTIMKGSLMAAAVGGTGTFFGPWAHNRVWAQGAKPIKLGLTCDASGQYGNSGQDEVRGIRLAIDEFNAKGGVLGRTRSSGSQRIRRPIRRPARASPSVSSPRTSAAS